MPPPLQPGDVASAEELGALAAQLGVRRPRQAMALQPAPQPPVGEFLLWAEHEAALDLYYAVDTQWRIGVAGPTGLDYAGVRAAPAFRRLGARREQVFSDLCHIERGWLRAHALRIRQQRQQQQPPPFQD